MVGNYGETIKDIFKVDNRNYVITRDCLPDFFTKENDYIDFSDFTDTNIAVAAWISSRSLFERTLELRARFLTSTFWVVWLRLAYSVVMKSSFLQRTETGVVVRMASPAA